jgi:hypothetical protein
MAFGDAGVQIRQFADEMAHGGFSCIALIKIQRQRSLV